MVLILAALAASAVLQAPLAGAFHVGRSSAMAVGRASSAAAGRLPLTQLSAENDNVTSSDRGDESSTETKEKETYDTRVMEMFLNQKYPAFMQLLSNQQIWEELRTGDGGYTIFAPNDKAFDALGEDKIRQLNDPRNVETTEKIGRYHAIAAPVTSQQIFDSNTGGVKTLGGEVPIGKTKSGGFLGGLLGGTEDGGVTVNGAKILESFEVTNCIVHEVDGLISPQLLWRYMDQLRIPGT